jgi:hypothetical protein
MSETRSLHRKLAQVMYEADRIPKNGTAPAAMGGFKFVQVGDAADVIRKALAEQKISMIPTAIELVDQTEHPSGADGKKVMTTMTVRTTWTLTDADTGETTVIQSLGSGGDTGDKAAPKAQSNAMKYALLMGFLLSTGDDPEMTDTSDRRPAGARREDAPRAPETARGGSLMGVAEVAKAPWDTEVRMTPDGPTFGFGLKEGRQIVRVSALGDLAQSIALVWPSIVGKRVECFGVVTPDEWIIAKGSANERKVPYLRLALERIATPDLILPAPASDTPIDSEIESLPLFDAA